MDSGYGAPRHLYLLGVTGGCPPAAKREKHYRQHYREGQQQRQAFARAQAYQRTFVPSVGLGNWQGNASLTGAYRYKYSHQDFLQGCGRIHWMG